MFRIIHFAVFSLLSLGHIPSGSLNSVKERQKAFQLNFFSKLSSAYFAQNVLLCWLPLGWAFNFFYSVQYKLADQNQLKFQFRFVQLHRFTIRMHKMWNRWVEKVKECASNLSQFNHFGIGINWFDCIDILCVLTLTYTYILLPTYTSTPKTRNFSCFSIIRFQYSISKSIIIHS